MENSNKRKPQNRQAGSVVRTGVLLLFALIFVIGAYMSLSILLERRSAADAYEALRLDVQKAGAVGNKITTEAESNKQVQKTGAETSEKTDAEKEMNTAPTPRVSMDFAPLQERCPNIRAWLFAEGTNIDYPIVQADNNDYYLTHLYNGESNASGSLFMDYRNTGLFTDQNTVIYGHHMQNGSMFGSLKLYKGQDFYDVYPTLLLYTPDGDYLIELICGTVEDGNYEFVRFEFDDDSELNAYIDSFRSRSTFQSDVEIGPGDRIVSLCTCSYEWDNARYMLIGKLTPIMENSTESAASESLSDK